MAYRLKPVAILIALVLFIFICMSITYYKESHEVKNHAEVVSMDQITREKLYEMTEFGKWIKVWGSIMIDLSSKLKAAGANIEGHIWDHTGTHFRRLLQLKTYFEYMTQHKNNIKQICETGFNGGHSTLMWASIFNGNISILAFDLCVDRRCDIGENNIRTRYPNIRLELIRGDSRISVPKYTENHDVKCDFISIDGGHFGDVPGKDITNMRRMAAKNHVIVVDDVDSKSSSAYVKNVGMAWDKAISAKEIHQIGKCELCYADPQAGKFCFGAYNLI